MKRFIVLALLAFSMFSLGTAGIIARSAEVESVGWLFGKGRGTAGWQALHDLESPTVTTEGILLRSTGGDPYLASPAFDTPTGEFQYIRIRAKAYTEGKAQVFYSLDGERFNESDSVSFGLKGDGEWHVYHVTPPWTARRSLQRLRFDLPGGEGNAVILSEVAVIERIVERPVPDFPDYDFTKDAETGPWMPDGGIAVLDGVNEGMRARLSEPRGEILSPPFEPVGEEHSWLILRLRNRGIERILFRWRSAAEKTFSPAHEIPINLPADGDMHTINTEVVREISGEIVQFSLVMLSNRVDAEAVFERIEFAEEPTGPAELVLIGAEFQSSLLPVGEPIAPLCTLRNVGGEPNDDGRYYLVLADIPGAKTMLPAGEGLVPVLQPGEKERVPAPRFDVPELQVPNPISVVVALHDGAVEVGSATAEGLATQTILKDAVSRPLPGVVSITEERPFGLVASNEYLQLRFPKNPFGYGVLMIDRYTDEETVPVGVLQSFGTLKTKAGDSSARIYCRNVSYEGIQDRGAEVIQFTGNAVTGPEETWTVSVEIRLPLSEPWFRVRTTVACERDTKVERFEFPSYLAGDGGFNADRDLGLFPGLEYLLPGEVSSAKQFVKEPFNLRIAPHPHKITIPLMAVQHEETWTGLIWDPLQEWDGIHDRPTALFSSPDRTGRTPGHRMGLIVPTIPEWRDENSLHSRRPYVLSAGETLSLDAVIFCVEGQDVDTPIQLWREVSGGFPEPPALPRTLEEALAAARVGFVESMWDAESKGWHRALNDPWGPAYVEEIYLDLVWSLITESGPGEAWSDRILQVVEEARKERVRKQGEAGLGLQVAFHEGHVFDQLEGIKRHAERLIAKQRNDGSFPFEPDREHAVFGECGDSSSGHTAMFARQIWQAAVLLNDSSFVDAGLKSLDYFRKQKRPEGAQTWELPLHVPDVLASAHSIQCYLMAYDLLGDECYLDEAETWAYHALPFIYLWNPADRPIMRYGSIPVFGATWFSGGWFGRIVQWNGLVLAEALVDLAERRPDTEWLKIAEGIVASGVQQQRPLNREKFGLSEYVPDCGHRGMYPDAYSAVEGTDAYHWCLSGHLLSKAIHRVLGGGPFLKRSALPAEDTTKIVHSVAQVLGLKCEEKQLRANLVFPSGLPHRVLVGGLESKPQEVTVSGRRISPMEEEPLIGEGWSWQDDLLLIAVRSASRVEQLEIVY